MTTNQSERSRPYVLLLASIVVALLAMAVQDAGAGMLAFGTERVPFVGCASDGQMGPIAAPQDNGTAPRVRRSVASELAYYATANIGVLAPRGWHCVALVGSAGETLIVTPEAHAAKNFLTSKPAPLTGPVIQISFSEGSTSGRFEVAQVAARLFPDQKAYVQRIAAEGIMPIGSFPEGPYAHDVVQRVSKRTVKFRTPAHEDGMGTRSRLAANDDPIVGVAIMPVDLDQSLVLVDIRLPRISNRAATTILEATRHRYDRP